MRYSARRPDVGEAAGVKSKCVASFVGLRGNWHSFLISAAIAVLLWKPVAAGAVDCRKVLNVKRGADMQELKRAYRREALRWHPDKNHAAGAEEKFREVARCYEVLSNPSDESVQGHSGRGNWQTGMQQYDTARAFRTFEDLFGDVHKNWKPGMKVSGTFVSSGRRARITINPDGSTEEHEESAGRGASYSSLYRSDGQSTSIEFQGDLGALVLDSLQKYVPLPALLIPAVALLLTVLCNPFVMCGICMYCCCFRAKQHVD